MTLLAVESLRKSYYGVEAVSDVTFTLAGSEITGLIGPNGSGKSTIFDCVTGFLRSDGGRVAFLDASIDGARPETIARRGLTRTFQSLRVFPELTVHQNLLAAAQAHAGFSGLREILGGGAVRRAEERARERAGDLLARVELEPQRDQLAGELSYGQQKLVELAIALMPRPRLVLLDEPVAGVNPGLIERIKEHIRHWNAEGVSFLVIEHNLRLILDLCHTVMVLDRGRLLLRDTPDRIADDARVIDAYLGRERTA